jgi:hypothetical protein
LGRDPGKFGGLAHFIVIGTNEFGEAVKGTFKEIALYNPSTMNARDFVALIRMAVISFVF